MGRTIKISDKAYEILSSTGKSMPEAVDDLVTKSNQNPVQVVTSGNPDSGSTGAEVLEYLKRDEARMKNIQDKIAKLEQVYIEMLAKLQGGR